MSLADYTLGGSPIPASPGKVSTLGFDYTLGGAPFQWMQDGAAGGASNQTVEATTATATGTSNDATCAPGAVTRTTTTATATGSAYNASCSAGAITVEATTAEATGAANDSGVSARITIVAGIASSTGSANDSACEPGSVTLTAGSASATGAAYAPTIFIQEDQTVEAGTATATGSAYGVEYPSDERALGGGYKPRRGRNVKLYPKIEEKRVRRVKREPSERKTEPIPKKEAPKKLRQVAPATPEPIRLTSRKEPEPVSVESVGAPIPLAASAAPAIVAPAAIAQRSAPMAAKTQEAVMEPVVKVVEEEEFLALWLLDL